MLASMKLKDGDKRKLRQFVVREGRGGEGGETHATPVRPSLHRCNGFSPSSPFPQYFHLMPLLAPGRETPLNPSSRKKAEPYLGPR